MTPLTRAERRLVALYGAEGFRRWQEGRRELLRRLLAKGWSQGEIASELGMSQQRVSKLLRELAQSS